MNAKPDNWDEMNAIQRHEWHVEQCRLQKQAAKPTTSIKQPYAQHKQHQRNAREQMRPVQELNGSPTQKQYFYWSTMVKEDAERLCNMPDHAERDKLKPTLLNKYREYLAEYMAVGETHDNNVLFWCLVWACDCQQFDYAIELTDYAVKTKQSSDIFKRSHEDFCADAIYGVVEKLLKQNQPLPDFFYSVFYRIKAEQWQVSPVFASRYYKTAGDDIREPDPTLALSYFQTALALNPDVGVKTRIKELSTH